MSSAVVKVEEQLGYAIEAGSHDADLLHALVVLLPFASADIYLVEQLERSPRVALRAWALVMVRVPIEQALTLADLEISAETYLRGVVTQAEAQSLAEQHLHDLFDERGEAAAGAQTLAELRERIQTSVGTDDDDPSTRHSVESELANHSSGSSISPELEHRVRFGPGTRYIDHPVWHHLVVEVARRMSAVDITARWPGLAREAQALAGVAKAGD